MTEQDYFNRAYTHYLVAQKLVMNAAGDDEEDGDPSPARFQFDMIVQYVLLRVGIADGGLCASEGTFIDNITDHYDILELFDGGGDDDFNWEFAGLNLLTGQVRLLADKLKKVAMPQIENFPQCFARMKEPARQDLLNKLVSELKEIIACFVLCDGFAKKQEVVAAQAMIHECLIRPWQNLHT